MRKKCDYFNVHQPTQRKGRALSVLPHMIRELQNVVTVPEFIAEREHNGGKVFPKLIKGPQTSCKSTFDCEGSLPRSTDREHRRKFLFFLPLQKTKEMH